MTPRDALLAAIAAVDAAKCADHRKGSEAAIVCITLILAHGPALLAALDDAERYRWLKDAPPHSVRWPRWRIEHWNGIWNPVAGQELDTAIDAARKP